VIDQHSPTWRAIVAHAAERRAAIRAEIDNPETPHDRTQVLRGRLLELDALLDLTAPPRPAIPFSSASYT
jgi:hypothetical protein